MLFSKEYKCCVYKTQTPDRILACVPASVRLANNDVAVPCTVPAMQTMCMLGYEAVSPILFDYAWPIRPPFKPFDHQRAMAAFLTLHPRCFNLSDIGTGKTLGTLWALDYLMKNGLIHKALILSPLSTIYRVWDDEIFVNFMGGLKATVLYGSRQKRLSQLAQGSGVYIINHDGLCVGSARDGRRGVRIGDLASQIRDDKSIDAVIVDEGSVYKDSGTIRYKILRQAIGNKPYVWWLTGTPTPNDPVDAWAQARAVRPEYQESQVNFKERTMFRVSTFKWVPRAGAADIVAKILQPAVRFRREDCIDLPPCVVELRDVELSDAQKKAYADLKKQLSLQMDKGTVTAVNEAVLRAKLIQISCGAVYGDSHEVNKIDTAPRLKILKEVIEQAGEKILVFAPLTSVVDLLYHELRDTYKCEVINGSTSSAKRNEVFRAFQQDKDPRIIIADPGTMAHGLTLTAASTIIWYGPTDRTETYIQANGRINRPGQTKSMLVVCLAATPVEREIFRRFEARESLQGAILKLVTEM